MIDSHVKQGNFINYGPFGMSHLKPVNKYLFLFAKCDKKYKKWRLDLLDK